MMNGRQAFDAVLRRLCAAERRAAQEEMNVQAAHIEGRNERDEMVVAYEAELSVLVSWVEEILAYTPVDAQEILRPRTKEKLREMGISWHEGRYRRVRTAEDSE